MVRVAVVQAVSPGPYSNSSGGFSPSPAAYDHERPQSQLSQSHTRTKSPDITIVYNCRSFEDLQQQDQESNEFLASLLTPAEGANNNITKEEQQQQQTMESNNNFNRFANKGGSLPGYYSMSTSAPTPFRAPSPSTIPPSAYYHNYSARPYTPTRPQQLQQAPIITSVTPPGSRQRQTHTYAPPAAAAAMKEPPTSKKSTWNPFGGLFRRKDKARPAPVSAPVTSVAAVPIKIQFEASQRPAVSSGPSDDEDYGAIESLSDSGSDKHKKRTSFLGRARKSNSNGKKKPAKVVHADHLRVPGGAPVILRQHPNGRQAQPVHRYSQPIFSAQGWETTKKPFAVVPPTSAAHSQSQSLLMLPRDAQAPYSDSGSLSLSLEGSSSLTRGRNGHGSKAATKMRAEARRSSYIEDSSSEEDARGGGGSGSHSSLSLRNKKNGQANGGASLAPMGLPQPPPTSPRWEARVVYTKETLEDNGAPVIVKLPKYANGGQPRRAQETLSSDVNEDGEIVVTAGLRVPIAMHADRVQVKEPIYANQAPPLQLPLPPKGLRPGGVYRPVSCSFLDSYHHSREGHSQEPQSILQYDQEPRRLRSPLEESSPVPLSATAVASKLLPTPSSPVHSRAANFWRQKERETLQERASISPSPSPSRSDRENGRPPAGRIRSADSSPLLQPKHATNVNTPAAKTSATGAHAPSATNGAPPGAHRSLNSTESISSLSSFTTNETHSPSPSGGGGSGRPPSRNALRGKIPAGHQQRSSYRSNRALATASAANIGRLSPNQSPAARSTPLNGNSSHTDGSRGSSIKSPGRNLEDALNELEDMYRSLQLSDEDLLDRAERRDLPTPHQELRNKDLGYFNFEEPYVNGHGPTNGHIERIQSPVYYYSPSPTGYGVGSLESLASGTGTSGSGEWRRPGSRVRAPPLRRSGIPDPIADDMARRKYDATTTQPKPTPDVREQISATGSYLVLSPAFSPPVSPRPPSADQQYQNYDPSQSNLLHSQPNDPDLTMDDVTVRNYRRANAIRIIGEPQPKFGIPLGPITAAADSDYLHATPVERFRPLYRHVKNPDLVKDDIAFRALRKDLNQEQNNLSSNQWIPKLWSPLRNFENVFNYNVATNGAGVVDEEARAKNKRLRAARSLSANISSLQTTLLDTERRKTPSPTRVQPPKNSFYKLNSYGPADESNNSDYKFTRASTPGSVAGSYMQPSWVQQIELDQDELRELKRSLSPTRVAPLIRSRDVNPVSVRNASARPPATRTASSPAATGSSSPKPRRPWTDLILEGVEKEKEAQAQAEREREQRLLEQEQILLQNGAGYEYDDEEDVDVDVDVYMDASAETPRDSPVKTHAFDRDPPKFKHVDPQPEKGHKNRPGSWAWAESNAAKGPVTQFHASVTSDTKRKSWSDFPQSTQAQAQYASGPHPSQTLQASMTAEAKLDFSPIPQPRRVKQINLEGFHSSESQNNDQQQQQLENVSHEKGERELDNLIHSLRKEADACGSTTPAAPAPAPEQPMLESKRKRKIEIKARYPIDDDSELFKSKSKLEPVSSTSSAQYMPPSATGPVTGACGSLEQSQPMIHTYSIQPSTDHDPITRLIRTINENLVPSLEKSIQQSETRRSQMNLATEAEREYSATEPSVSAPAAKPKPLPRQQLNQQQGESIESTDKSKTGTDKPSQSQSKGSKLEAEANTYAFTPLTITKSTLCIGKWPQPSTAKAIPSIEVTDLDTTVSYEKPFLRKKKDSGTVSMGATSLTTGVDEDGDSKRDSLSDAEGMTLLKKLLHRENSVHTQQHQQPQSDYFLGHGHSNGIKKSPSTGTTILKATPPSNVNLSTPPFLRKYFTTTDTAAPVTETRGTWTGVDVKARAASYIEPMAAPAPAPQTQPPPQDVLALNVAQKANLFMKMEHEQRFSKWRKNSEAEEPKLTVPAASTRQNTSRFATQPVTNHEFSAAAALSVGHMEQQPHSDDMMSSKNIVSEMEAGTDCQQLSQIEHDDSKSETHNSQQTRKRSLLSSVESLTAPATVVAQKPAAARIEPSCLSIKDRVSLFNRMATLPTAAVNPIVVNTQHHKGSPATSASELSPQSAPERWNRPTASASGYTHQIAQQSFKNPQTQAETGLLHNNGRQSSHSRQTKGKSLTMAHTWEPDCTSEDGEVSSGGQEVSDIISKSYDNSPMFRKKSWKSQIPQPSLSKEIWRKFENHAVPDVQEFKPMPTEPVTRRVNPGFVKERIESMTNMAMPPPTTNLSTNGADFSVRPSSSSNLLSILRVLSSSDDADPDPDPLATEYAAKLNIDAASSLAKDPSKKSVRKYLKMRTATATATTDSVQAGTSFQKQKEPIYDNVSASIGLNAAASVPPEPAPPSLTELSDVQREGDLLVMKKHMPSAKRKSSHKSRNPLKVLAARLQEFKNQD